MNGLVILCALLLIIPAQLFFNYITSSDTTNPSSNDNPQQHRTSRLLSALQKIEQSIEYYSTFEHFKEFFVVPHRPRRDKLKDKFRSFTYKDPSTGKEVSIQILNDRKDKKSKGVKDSSTDTNRRRGGDTSHEAHSRGGATSKPMSKNKGGGVASEVNEGTSAAVEVETYNKELLYFARSPVPRIERPHFVKYRVGDVVRHVNDGYHGVIVGWDIKCKAPEWWLRKHGYDTDRRKLGFMDQPHYLVLVDTSDEDSPDDDAALYYLPQPHLSLDQATTLNSEKTEVYFSHYSRSTRKYSPKDWLKKRYPKDL